MNFGALFVLFIFLHLFTCFAYIASNSHNDPPPSASARIRNDHYKDGVHDEHIDHQSILGSKKEADSFDKMSPEESKKRLRILATTKMDLNQDGFVDRDELTTWIYNSIQNLDKEETDERFDEMDENNDQLVSWAEYKNDAFGDDEDEADAEDDKALMIEDFRYFQAADQNGDGKLTKDEFAAFQNPESHEHMHFSLIDNTLKEKDTNKDGFLDLVEFLGTYANKKDSEWYSVEKSRFTDEYDKNGDGRLDRSEMESWLVPNSMATAKEEVDHLFSEADHNKDDKLSYIEIESEYNLFVGSEATNYGEHLEDMEHDEL